MLDVVTVAVLVTVVGLSTLDVATAQVPVTNAVLQTRVAPASVASQADEEATTKRGCFLSASQS